MSNENIEKKKFQPVRGAIAPIAPPMDPPLDMANLKSNASALKCLVVDNGGVDSSTLPRFPITQIIVDRTLDILNFLRRQLHLTASSIQLYTKPRPFH